MLLLDQPWGIPFSFPGNPALSLEQLVPWEKSYDQPKQHIKMQRHNFADKGLSSQGYGFSSGHVWM